MITSCCGLTVPVFILTWRRLSGSLPCFFLLVARSGYPFWFNGQTTWTESSSSSSLSSSSTDWTWESTLAVLASLVWSSCGSPIKGIVRTQNGHCLDSLFSAAIRCNFRKNVLSWMAIGDVWQCLSVFYNRRRVLIRITTSSPVRFGPTSDFKIEEIVNKTKTTMNWTSILSNFES